MNPRETIALIQTLKESISVHPMCAKWEETGTHYIVIYPLGSHPMLDGIRIHKGMGQIAALKRVLSTIELHYKQGYPSWPIKKNLI